MPKSVLRVAAVQMKFRQTLMENVQLIRGFIARAALAGIDAILFPECALTGYNVDFRQLAQGAVEDGLEAVGSVAREHHCYVLIGAPAVVRGRRFNSLFVFDRRGRETFRYDKIHLTARDLKFFK